MNKGKNFSTNNINDNRNGKNFYQTPYSITEQLLEVESFFFNNTVYDPCCGNGAITKILSKYFNYVYYSDKYAYNFNTINIPENKKENFQIDFLLTTKKYDYIIANPPYKLTKEFILHAKKVCKNKFCFLLPLSYLHGVNRYHTIYQDKEFPLKYIYVFTRYPMLSNNIREDGKYKTGMMIYAWYIWDKKYQGEPIIKWIDNQKYIVNAKDK